jgi:hypothetical protein
MLNVVKEAADDPELRRELANPYSLCPDGYTPQLRQPNVSLAEYDTDFKSWIAPFRDGGDQHPDRASHERAVEAGVRR